MSEQRISELETELAEARKEVEFLQSKECEAAWCDRWKKICAEKNELESQLLRCRDTLKKASQRLYQSVYHADRVVGLSYEEANEHGNQAVQFINEVL